MLPFFNVKSWQGFAQEANTFKAYAIDKEYSKAMKTLEKYRQLG
jgi:hypothetical protein